MADTLDNNKQSQADNTAKNINVDSIIEKMGEGSVEEIVDSAKEDIRELDDLEAERAITALETMEADNAVLSVIIDEIDDESVESVVDSAKDDIKELDNLEVAEDKEENETDGASE